MFLNELKLIILHTVKWFQVLLRPTNNSLKLHSFTYTQLNDQTVQFQSIQLSISHLLALSLNAKQFYLTLSGGTTSGQSVPGSDGNEGVLSILQSSPERF